MYFQRGVCSAKISGPSSAYATGNFRGSGPGDTSPLFGTDMKWISGSLPPLSSSTFCDLTILGGSDLTGASLGEVDLTPAPGGKFQVDSFFDVSYQISCQSCPGSILDGISGVSDVAVVHMEAAGLGPSVSPVPALNPFAIAALALSLGGALGMRKLRSQG